MQRNRFPAPVKLSPRCTRWRLSDLESYENQQLDGKPSVATSPDERYLTDKQVAARYGVSRQTPWRWAEGRGDAR